MQDAYRGSVVYKEDDEDDYSDDDDAGDSKPKRKLSFKKKRTLAGAAAAGAVPLKSPKLADLMKTRSSTANKYAVDEPIEEANKESPESAARPSGATPRAGGSSPFAQAEPRSKQNKLSLRLTAT